MQRSANEMQVGGDHYKVGGEEHWDRVARLNLDYFQGQITKYVERWKKKNGIQDLEKAQHFLTKYIEVEKAKVAAAGFSVKPHAYFALDEPVQAWPFQVLNECAAVQMSSSMVCRECGISWDVNDAAPPTCPRTDGSAPGAGYVNQD